ncbi:hypothetical protein VNO77_41680 [Canavalia gladiata]|uniref:Uncharacterized protein n=1 Tax=Canavalia gladiata TaxID=3824 RepID=A0AAN9JZC0_CANGL
MIRSYYFVNFLSGWDELGLSQLFNKWEKVVWRTYKVQVYEAYCFDKAQHEVPSYNATQSSYARKVKEGLTKSGNPERKRHNNIHAVKVGEDFWTEGKRNIDGVVTQHFDRFYQAPTPSCISLGGVPITQISHSNRQQLIAINGNGAKTLVLGVTLKSDVKDKWKWSQDRTYACYTDIFNESIALANKPGQFATYDIIWRRFLYIRYRETCPKMTLGNEYLGSCIDEEHRKMQYLV